MTKTALIRWLRVQVPALGWLLAVVAVVVTAVAGYGRWWTLPDRHNPFAPLRIADEPGWLTRYKLERLDSRPADCLVVLSTALMTTEPVPDRSTGPSCGFSNAVRVRRTALLLDTPFVLSCRGAVSLALWERHVVLPAADRWLGTRPQRLLHFGSYACRNVYGRETGSRSRHATADALDVAGFALATGRRITVAGDWAGNDGAAQFLRTVHRGGCRWFDGVLGPDYNREHADHLHLDRGPYRVCR